jgi:hypothetical protein
MKQHKYAHLDEEETSFIREWYNNQENSENIRRIIEKNPIYFSRSIDLCRDKTKAFTSMAILSYCNGDCKQFFFKYFNKYVITIQDLVVFLDRVKLYRGFGKVIRLCVYNWFKDKTLDQITKELTSNLGNTSWTNRDILNKFHIKPWNADISNVFRTFVEKEKNNG